MSLHARATNVSVQPQMVEETIRIYEESIKPALMSQKGIHQVSLLMNRATGKGISITVWESEADGVAYEASGAYREQVAKVAPFFAAPPSLETFEVAVGG
jgi:heme-degrading monooxygenase HmoA